MNRTPRHLFNFFSSGKGLNPLKIFVSFKGLRKRHNLKSQKGKHKYFRAERTSSNVSKLASILKELIEILFLMGFVNTS